MASVDVPVALLGYGTVGAAVNRLLTDSADDIERATGHRIRLVKALVRDPEKERDYPPVRGVLTTDFSEIADDPSEQLVELRLIECLIHGALLSSREKSRRLAGGAPKLPSRAWTEAWKAAW